MTAGRGEGRAAAHGHVHPFGERLPVSGGHGFVSRRGVRGPARREVLQAAQSYRSASLVATSRIRVALSRVAVSGSTGRSSSSLARRFSS